MYYWWTLAEAMWATLQAPVLSAVAFEVFLQLDGRGEGEG